MFRKWPPSLSVPIFYIFVTAAYLYRFFLGSIYGILLIAMLTYYFSKKWFGTTPLDLAGLMQWILNQSESTKAALLGSMITVVGFIVAYATATANWKSQFLANLKVQAAGEIEVFFTEFSKLSTDCAVYSGALVDAVNKIQAGCPVQEAEFLARYNREQGQLFLQRRQQLIALGIDVHRSNHPAEIDKQ